MQRAIGGIAHKLPSVIVASLRGGPVAGGAIGLAGASATITLAIYDLTVDGRPRGSWVATIAGQVPQLWTFVAAGGSLPDGRSAWPA